MKITKRQLRRIIKEEMGEWDKGRPGYERGVTRGDAKRFLVEARDKLWVGMDYLKDIDPEAQLYVDEAYRKIGNVIAFLNTDDRSKLNEQSQTAGPPLDGRHAIALGGSYGGPPKNKMFDIEMEARDTAINIFKGGGDREEVMMTLHELFPDISDYLDAIVADAEEMLEFGVR